MIDPGLQVRFWILSFSIVLIALWSCGEEEKSESGAETITEATTEDEVGTKVSVESSPTQIELVVIYPKGLKTYAQGGKDNETYIKEQIAKVNGIWDSQSVGGSLGLVGYVEIDYSSYSETWQADLVKGLMNHTDFSNIHPELQSKLTNILDEYKADCLVYWRDFGDGSSAVSGATMIGADRARCMLQLTYWAMDNVVTFAHEFGHLQGCRHEHGYESPSKVKFTYEGGDTVEDYYRTIMTTTDRKSVDGTSLSEVWKFSTPLETMETGVKCSRYEPTSSGGTRHNDYTCDFSSASIGESDEITCLGFVKESIKTFSSFR